MNAVPETVPFGAPVLDGLALLADPTRSRLLAILDGIELTVAELCDALALPQSTVSRHLKTLGDAGWVAARRDGASPLLRAHRRPPARGVAAALGARARRRRRVARGRATTGAGCSRCSTAARVGSVQFFSTAAGAVGRPARRAVRRDQRPAHPPRAARPRPPSSATSAAARAGSPRRSRPSSSSVVAVDASAEMLDGRARAPRRLRQRPPARRQPRSAADRVRDARPRARRPRPAPRAGARARAGRGGPRAASPAGGSSSPTSCRTPHRSTAAPWATSGSASIAPRSKRHSPTPGSTAGLWHELAIEAGAKGPGLFVATATRPRRPHEEEPPDGNRLSRRTPTSRPSRPAGAPFKVADLVARRVRPQRDPPRRAGDARPDGAARALRRPASRWPARASWARCT